MSADRYEIRGKIGQGGVGAVYRAYDTQLRREVAMKRVLQDGDMNSEDATANLLKEATALSSVQHPHIVTVYDAGIDNEGPYVVMELINGKTLDEMVERGTLTYEDFKEVAVQSQEAMIAAQDLDLVHRDLKPSNVMVSWLPSGRFQVKIVDFGLAKFSAKPSLQTIDHGDAVFGSIFFMAPEQFERTPLDRRTDMYSLGAMYYYALSGDYPFNGDTAPQVMAAHLQNKVKPLAEVRPDLPPWLCDWVMWHIRRDMTDRPESARVALEHFLAHDSAHTMSVSASQATVAAAQPAAPAQQAAVSGNTAPQPILSPTGQINPHTATQPLATAAQPANLNAGAAAAPVTSQQAQGAQPQQAQAPGQPQQIPPGPALSTGGKKGPSGALIAVVAIVVLILIAIVLFLVLGKGKEGVQIEEVNALAEKIKGSKEVSISEEQFDLILAMVAGEEKFGNNNTLAALLIVAKGDGYNVDTKLGDFVVKGRGGLPAQTLILSEVISKRAYNKKTRPSSFDQISKWLPTVTDKSLITTGLNSLIGFADLKNDFDPVLDICMSTADKGVTEKSTQFLAQVINRSKDTTAAGTRLSQLYQSETKPEKRKALITIAAASGASSATPLLIEAIKIEGDTVPDVAKHAIKALGAWNSIAMIDPIVTSIKNCKLTAGNKDQIDFRKNAFTTATSILIGDNIRENPASKAQWDKLVITAANDIELSVLGEALANVPKKWSITLLEEIQKRIKDANRKARIGAAIKNVQRLL